MAKGTAILDFGSGNQLATVTVTGQTNILSGSKVEAYIMADTSADHDEDEHLMMQSMTTVTVPVSSIVPGASFDIRAFSDQLLYGRFIVNYATDYT